MVGKLAFIGIAQSAGFKLSEIKNLVQSIECALFAAPGEKPAETDLALTVVHVEGGDCRRASEWA